MYRGIHVLSRTQKDHPDRLFAGTDRTRNCELLTSVVRLSCWRIEFIDRLSMHLLLPDCLLIHMYVCMYTVEHNALTWDK